MPNSRTHCCLNCYFNDSNSKKGDKNTSNKYYCLIRDIDLESPLLTYCENFTYSPIKKTINNRQPEPSGTLKVLDYFVIQGESADNLKSNLKKYMQDNLSVSPQHAEQAAINCIKKTALNYDLWKISINNKTLSDFGFDRLLLSVYCGLGYNTKELLSMYTPNTQELREIIYSYLCR